MKLLFIADANSTLVRRWIGYFRDVGDDICVVSHYPVQVPLPDPIRLYEVPMLVGRLAHLSSTGVARTALQSGRPAPLIEVASRVLRGLNSTFGLHRAWLGYAGPLEARRLAPKIRRIVRSLQPDLVHAMRIPMEGESVASIPGPPLVLSVWGNDFTLWTSHYGGHRRLAMRALRRACGLHADCHRDIRLARELGFDPEKPTLVSPGGAGILTSESISTEAMAGWRERLCLPKDAQIVINPRGVRPYVCTGPYMQAIPRVVRQCPKVVFVSVGVHGDPVIARLLQDPVARARHRSLPTIRQDELAALFELADVMVSPTTHDGTPNTLLEAMAHGAFPVCGDLESIREWITDGVNGVLVDAGDPDSIARGIVRALQDDRLRSRAAAVNLRLVRERAEYHASMAKAREFYLKVIERHQSLAPDRPGSWEL